MKTRNASRSKGVKPLSFSVPKVCTLAGRRDFAVVARAAKSPYEVSVKQVLSELSYLAASDIGGNLVGRGRAREIAGDVKEDAIQSVACLKGAMAIVQKWAKGEIQGAVPVRV